MPEKLGRWSRLNVDVSTTGTGGATANWVEIPQRTDYSVEESMDTADVSHAGTNQHKKKIPTDADWTGSVDIVYWPGDPLIRFLQDQLRIRQVGPSPTDLWLQVDESTNGGRKEEAPCLVTGISTERPYADKMTRTISFSGQARFVTSP